MCFHGNNKVHRANEAPKQLGFAFLSYLNLYRPYGPLHGQTLASHNLPTNRARELIKPSPDSASFRLEIVKKIFRLGIWVLCVLGLHEFQD